MTKAQNILGMAALSWLVVAEEDLQAQRLTERWLTINPLAAETSPDSGEGWSFLGVGHMWGEFGPYRLSRDNDHAWSVKFGGFLELFRIRNDASLAFLSSIELVSDPHNDLRFNPRVMFWEEGFLYTIRAEEVYWQIGYYHRCKHDIDNLLPAPSYAIGVQRALIYGSILGKLLLPWKISDPGIDGLSTLRADLYTILQDERLPRSTFITPINLEQAIGTVGITSHVRFPWSGRIGGFATGYASLTIFGEESGFVKRMRKLYKGTIHGGIATGITLQGAMHLRIGVGYEYLADTGVNPEPGGAHLVLLSVSFLAPETIW